MFLNNIFTEHQSHNFMPIFILKKQNKHLYNKEKMYNLSEQGAIKENHE